MLFKKKIKKKIIFNMNFYYSINNMIIKTIKV